MHWSWLARPVHRLKARVLVVAGFVLVTTGCLPVASGDDPTRTPGTGTGGFDTAGLTGDELPDDTESATVADVVDGDTIEVTFLPDNRQVDLRLIGINAPESVRPNYPVECYGPEAGTRLAALLPVGTVVYLERDVSDRDQFGRLLRHVWIVDEATDGAFLVSEMLVRGGFVDARVYPPDERHTQRLADAERAARDDRVGMWGGCEG